MCQDTCMAQERKSQNFGGQHTRSSAWLRTQHPEAHLQNTAPRSTQPHTQSTMPHSMQSHTYQPARKPPSPWRSLTRWGIIFAGITLAFTIFFAILLSLGARPEHVDLTPEPASTAEQQRQSLAIAAQRIAASQNLSQQAAEAAKQAQTWLDQLGGVWVPWPQGAPEGYENPSPDTSAYSSLDQLRQAVWEFSTAVLSAHSKLEGAPLIAGDSQTNGAKTDKDSDNADSVDRTVAEIGIDAIYAGIALDREAGAEPTCDAPHTSDLVAAFSSHPDTLKNLDTARQWLEYKKTFSPSDELNEQVNALGTLIDTALDSGAPDTRQVMAPPPTDNDHAGTLVYETLKKWMASTTSAKERTTITNAACMLAATIGK